ncbi:MAG: cytochrome c oxidase subunit II [Phycisphaerales bacterium]|jgi:cytochrome c oxidase subunit 2|nr:cytochrome c oxidase subunit II [Phycisphaerales bacterium]MDP6692949.1 cytochrome c oxidase subunit II [Phycisphaerales bacterium]
MIEHISNLLLATATATDNGNFWLPRSASTVAGGVDLTFNVITWICYFFFALIVGLMVVFCIKYRRTSPDINIEGPTHNTALELTWTVIPLILVVVIFTVGMRGYLNLREAPEGCYEVQVTGQKWSWTFNHTQYGATEVAELTVPVGKPVRLLMTSNDVLHSVWIPDFRVKMDVIPGRYTSLWFEATSVGDYQLNCTEYCGKDHSKMLAIVHVIPANEFDSTMKKLASEYEDMSIGQLPAYAINRLYNRCVSCHSLDGTSGTGPSFKGLWDRVSNGQVSFTNGDSLSSLLGDATEYGEPENYIRESIVNPQKHIVQGYLGSMPAFQGQLKEKQITAIIEMFKHLRDVTDANGNITVKPDGSPTE